MELTQEQAQDIIYGDHSDWEHVKDSKEITYQSRWDVYKAVVCLHKPSGEHYRFSYAEGATEYQDYNSFEMEGYEKPFKDFTKVELREVTVTKWVPVDEND